MPCRSWTMRVVSFWKETISACPTQQHSKAPASHWGGGRLQQQEEDDEEKGDLFSTSHPPTHPPHAHPRHAHTHNSRPACKRKNPTSCPPPLSPLTNSVASPTGRTHLELGQLQPVNLVSVVGRVAGDLPRSNIAVDELDEDDGALVPRAVGVEPRGKRQV
jgi:hypothetical protein